MSDTEKLDALRKQYALGTLSLETPDGRAWCKREEAMDAYFRHYSRNWNENREILVDFSKMVAEFGTYVAIAYPVINNFVLDMWYGNPEPYIQDKGGDADLSRIMTDVAKSVHVECDTETEVRHALQDQTWAGFGLIAGAFKQSPYNAGEAIMEPELDDYGAEVPDEATGQPRMRDTGSIVEPTEQRIEIRRISPWNTRFDPAGRRWDMSDHRYWAFDTYEYLGDLMRDPLLSDDDKRRLMAIYFKGSAAFSEDNPDAATIGDSTETDPDFIRVCIRNIWSRPDHMIYRKPHGARFTFTPQPWDEEWRKADMFPVRYMPRNRVPEDQKFREGFIGMADLTLIRPHIHNINKAQSLLTANLGRVIDVYVTVKGALTAMEAGKIEDAGRMFRILQIDPDALKKFPSVQENGTIRMSDIMHLLPTGDQRDLQHMAFMDHEFSLIQQILSQGPGDRGGVPDTDTATESLGVQRGVTLRKAATRRDTAKHYNAITKMIFIMISSRHTLPLRYQAATHFNQKTWQTLVDPVGTLKNIDLHFDYATGTTEARTREEEFRLRERMAQVLMPVFQAQQDWRNVLRVAQDLVEPLNLYGIEKFFDDKLVGLVMQLLVLMRGLGKGRIGEMELTADNIQIIQQIPELIAQIAAAVLTPGQMAEAEAMVQGAAPPADNLTGTGSLPKADSAGSASAQDAAAGSAAAGQIGGLLNAGTSEKQLM